MYFWSKIGTTIRYDRKLLLFWGKMNCDLNNYGSLYYTSKLQSVESILKTKINNELLLKYTCPFDLK